VTGHRDPALSTLLGRDVRLLDRAAPGASIERMDPDQVRTDDDLSRAQTGSSTLAAGSPPGTFFDFAPLQLMTTATPRCVVPALRHGDGQPDVALLQVLSRHNRLRLADVGVLPCAGVYARPLEAGVIRSGDPVEFC